jgi:hypothetical protein
MFTLYIKYITPEALHCAHSHIKSLDFILGPSQCTLDEAHDVAIAYINQYFSGITEQVAWVKKLPPTPKTELEWDAIKPGYFCTESALAWELTVWKKVKYNGAFFSVFSSFKIEEIFRIKILQVCQNILQEFPSVKWLSNPLCETDSEHCSENLVSDSSE